MNSVSDIDVNMTLASLNAAVHALWEEPYQRQPSLSGALQMAALRLETLHKELTELKARCASLSHIGELIRTQNNRITEAPMFIVQERKRDYGFDLDYCDEYVWVDAEADYAEATEEESAELDQQDRVGEAPDNWLKAGFRDRWEFVTACFTEQGCKDFIAADGHNHGELRIYADGSYRNAEYRLVRDFLASV